jgi:CMP-N-acetylneuraminic acid synthetase
MTEVLALVTARGGSKGIPRKNLVPFLGRPLIAWSIEAAQLSKSVTRIVVSTDNAEIAAAAREAGAEVPFVRPDELARDDTLDLPVFRHALEWLAENENYRPDVIVHLRPTTPLRPPGLIDEGVGMLSNDPEADAVRSVCIPMNNPFKMWRIVDGIMTPLVPCDIEEPYNQPRQKLPVAYWQTGTVDVTRPRTILELGSMTGRRILPLVIDTALAIDIDDPVSLEHGERIMERFRADRAQAGATYS